MDRPKRFLFVLRRGPDGPAPLQESLDMIFTAAAFDQPVSVLFLDDSVERLVRPVSANQESAASPFEAFELYDVQPVWVESESLAARSVRPEDLAIPVEPIARDAIAALAADFDVLIAAD